MPTVIVFHEIDDSAHWLASPKRMEVFSPYGLTARTFLDPANPHRAAVLVEAPDMETFQRAMESPEAAEAMASDGVRGDTVVVLLET